MDLHGHELVDIPQNGFYIKTLCYDQAGEEKWKAVCIKGNALHENKNYCTLNYESPDRNGKLAGVFFTTGKEEQAAADPDVPSDDDWVVEITSPEKSPGTDFDISPFFTEEQKAVLTDENAAGPNYDGVGRKIHVYFVGTKSKSLETPYELPWVDEPGAKNEKVFSDLEALGFYPNYDAPMSGYCLDSSLDLQLDYSNQAYKLRVTYEP